MHTWEPLFNVEILDQFEIKFKKKNESKKMKKINDDLIIVKYWLCVI